MAGYLQWRTCQTYLTCGSLAPCTLTSRRRRGGSLAGAGLLRGGGGVGGAELDSRSVLQRVLARLHLKRQLPDPHQPQILTSFSLVGRVGLGPPADHAADCEEGRGCQ